MLGTRSISLNEPHIFGELVRIHQGRRRDSLPVAVTGVAAVGTLGTIRHRERQEGLELLEHMPQISNDFIEKKNGGSFPGILRGRPSEAQHSHAFFQ